MPLLQACAVQLQPHRSAAARPSPAAAASCKCMGALFIITSKSDCSTATAGLAALAADRPAGCTCSPCTSQGPSGAHSSEASSSTSVPTACREQGCHDSMTSRLQANTLQKGFLWWRACKGEDGSGGSGRAKCGAHK